MLDGTLHTQVYVFIHISIRLALIMLFRIFRQKDEFYKFIELLYIVLD